MVGENYSEITKQYLEKAFSRGMETLTHSLPAELKGEGLIFKAFGKECQIKRSGILLNGKDEKGPKGVLISIYAAFAPHEAVTNFTSWISFKDLPDTMPYWGPFRANAEEILIPFVEKIHRYREEICNHLDGYVATGTPGDFALILFPLPKFPLLYIFYLSDEEFPAEAKCLFAGGEQFMPADAMADIAEHTSRLLTQLSGGARV